MYNRVNWIMCHYSCCQHIKCLKTGPVTVTEKVIEIDVERNTEISKVGKVRMRNLNLIYGINYIIAGSAGSIQSFKRINVAR